MRLILIFALLIGCYFDGFTQVPINPQSLFGSWNGYTKIRGKDGQLGCEFDVNFRLILNSDYSYNIEVIDYSEGDIGEMLCYIAIQGLWEAFLEYHNIEYAGFELSNSSKLKLKFTGIDNSGKLAHIRQEASNLQIVRVSNTQLVIKVGLLTSTLGNETIFLDKEH